MRRELLYSPHLLLERLLERLLESASRRHRLRRLRRTPARVLGHGHIDSLELLEIVQHDVAPRTIYDVGANRGTWSLLARTICPQAEVHAFEPLASLHEEFRRLVADVGLVTLHAVALGAEPVSRPMFVHNFVDSSSFFPLSDEEAARFPGHLREIRTLDVSPLDSYVESRRLPLPELIKLDVQGFEIEVLKGAPRTLAHARAVITEVSFREIYAGQPLFGSVAGFLSSAGLEPVAFAHGMRTGTRLSQADVLFVRA